MSLLIPYSFSSGYAGVGGWRPMAAAAAGAGGVHGRQIAGATGGRGTRGVGDAAPYGREGPVSVIASQCAHWRGNPYLPSPFSMFSNGNLKTPQFSIFNSLRGVRTGCMAGRLPALQAGLMPDA